MNQQAKGPFEVTIKPAVNPDIMAGVTLGRISIDKTFEGDLVGMGKGELLTAMTSMEGSAGYVAIEQVTGTLHGRSGSFVFQHTGVMERDAQELAITVVPDLGAGELVGISGRFVIDIVDGAHHYVFDYALPE